MNEQLLLHYRLGAALGAGAMGVVYRAYDTRLQRTVAIKRLQDPSPGLSVVRLLEEARAASTLNHPGICTIFDVGEADGQAFIVMEFVDGRPLSDLIPSGGLPLQTVIDYGRQIADAVGYAHEAGIVHRDIKSSNVVITKSGRAVILDFGLARRVPLRGPGDVAVSGQLTTLSVAGTPAYMAPEALRGEAVSPRIDVWSLGVVLYEMATGTRPYAHGTPFQLAADVLSEAPVAVPETVAPAVSAIITRCLAKQPERRYRQAGEVRAALEALQPGSEIAPAPAPAAPTRRIAAPGRWAIAMAAAGVLGIVLAVDRVREPIGRLIAAPAIAFAERDWLLVADFNNQTGDPVFDRGLHTALLATLGQSRYVNLVPANRIRESLARMNKTGLTRTDEATAVEIALREGVRLVLSPSIASTGGSYLLAAALVDPATGATLRSATARAATKGAVLAALDDLSARVRSDLGEASTMITAQGKPLIKVTTSSLEALQKFSLGRDAHTSQQLETARSLFEEALRIDPAFTAARASLGMINVEFFDRAKGLELLTQALNAIDGLTDNERLSVQGFHALAVERNFEKAAGLYRAFLAVHPDIASAHNNLGRVYMQMRQFDQAVSELQEAIRLDPDLFLSYFSLNSIYLYEQADLDAAIQTAERQLARNPRSARALGQLAAAYSGRGDLRQAEATYRKSLEIDPRSPFEWYRLGHTLRLQSRFEEARQAYLRIRDLDAKGISALYDAGVAAHLMGDEAQARRDLRTVVTESEQHLRVAPGDEARRLEMGSALARLGEIARASTIANRPADAEAGLPVERAGLLVCLRRTDEALALLDKAVSAGFRNIVWIRLHSDLHELQGDPRFEAIVARMRSQA